MFPLSLVAVPIVALYLVYKYLVFPIFLSPLSKLPNAHFSSSFSPLWILLRRYHGEENRAIYAAHVKHGDIVRLGPNEVSVACVDEGIRTVYGGGFEKWNWYPNQFENYGYSFPFDELQRYDADPPSVPNMFSMANSKSHSIRKRMISNIYSKSYLQSSSEVHAISKVMIFDRLLPLLEEAANNKQPLDVLELNFSSTMDFIIAFIFGLQNGTNFIQDIPTRQEWLSIYQSRRPFRFWAGELPGVVSFFKKLGIHITPAWVSEASKWLEDWTMEKCKAANTSVSGSKDHFSGFKETSESLPTTTPPVVYTQLLTSFKQPSPYPIDLSIATEIHDHLAAGHETSGISLTYLFHELSLHLELQTRLRNELRTLSPSLSFASSSRTYTLEHFFPNSGCRLNPRTCFGSNDLQHAP